MLKKIKDISIYPSFECNQRCVYCYIDTETPQELVSPKSIGKFIASLPLDSEVIVRFFGGEPTLSIDRIKAIVKELTKISQRSEVKFNCITYSNGTDADALLDLLDNKILTPESTKVSWDGPSTCVTTRLPKNCDITDNKLMNNISRIGHRYGNRVGLVYAIHPSNISTLYESLIYALECGYKDFSYYFLQGYVYPSDKDFLFTLKDQLEKICQEYITRKDDPFLAFHFHNLDKFRNRNGIISTMDIIRCSGLEESIAILPNGNVHGCPCTATAGIHCIGNVAIGIDQTKIAELEKAYASPALCKLGCKNAQCHQCPVITDIYGLDRSKELVQGTCIITHAETEVLSRYI